MGKRPKLCMSSEPFGQVGAGLKRGFGPSGLKFGPPMRDDLVRRRKTADAANGENHTREWIAIVQACCAC